MLADAILSEEEDCSANQSDICMKGQCISESMSTNLSTVPTVRSPPGLRPAGSVAYSAPAPQNPPPNCS